MRRKIVNLFIHPALILCILAFSVNNLYSQLRFDYPITEIEPVELIANYSLEFIEDTLNTYYIRKDEMILFIGKSTSKYLSRALFEFDTIMKNINSFEQLQSRLLDQKNPLPFSKFGYRIYKNYPTDFITYIEHIPSTTFRYQEDFNQFNWQLINDTATINGYFTQKAITDFGGRSWIAWFCPNIPYNDGPYKFCGLPGLIVKVYDTKNHYTFTLNSLNIPENDLMIELVEKDYVFTTKEDFRKAKDNFFGNIINRAKDAGLDSESQQIVARKSLEKNNPIELINRKK